MLFIFSQGNSNDIQSASELIRELIDHGGVFDPETYQWREVQDVTFLTTYNPHTSATVPRIGKRLLRHFSLLHVPYPRYLLHCCTYIISIINCFLLYPAFYNI